VRGLPSGLLATAVIVALPPRTTVEGFAEQLMVGGADAGVLTATAVVADAVSPWLSVTLQITVTVPAVTPVVFSVAVLPLLATVPEEALQL
jgi:hypothetical protein